MFRGNARLRTALVVGALALSLAACKQKMGTQPAYDPYVPSDFFPDGMSARPLVAGTVARGTLREDAHLYTGKVNNQLVNSFPFPVTEQVLDRGEERFNIYCSMCHGMNGTGDGMIVRRGYRQPPSFHTVDLRARKAGHLFDVITNGFGAMPAYGTMIPVEDRWAIVAYVRVLQLSRTATVADVPPGEAQKLQAGGSK